MNMTLDHVFILVEPGAKVADQLLKSGFQEGPSNTHPGQGTANRRFYFADAMLEFIWVHDANEAKNGPGQKLHFAERAKDPSASPFGVILVPQETSQKDSNSPDMPFPGWHYQPAYFPPPKGFHVGANAHNITEPLCFYFSSYDSGIPPDVPKPKPHRNPQSVSDVSITTPLIDTEGVLALASQTERLSIKLGEKHLMEITLDYHSSRQTADYRPAMPLILHW